MSNVTRKRELLPPGFLRTEAGSLRVQIRITGHKPVVRTFAIFEDSPDARRRQLDDATAWAVDTRRRLKAGNLVDTRQAETTTLGTVLERYERDGLKGKDSNAQKDRNRIRQIMSDPIAMRPVIGLKKSDVAAYRERLIADGRAKSLAAAMRRLDDAGGRDAEARKADLRRLEVMRSEAASAEPARRRILERVIAEVQVREGVKEPARTTISNKVQLITRALGGFALCGAPRVWWWHIGSAAGAVPSPWRQPWRRADPSRCRPASATFVADDLGGVPQRMQPG